MKNDCIFVASCARQYPSLADLWDSIAISYGIPHILAHALALCATREHRHIQLIIIHKALACRRSHHTKAHMSHNPGDVRIAPKTRLQNAVRMRMANKQKTKKEKP